MAVLVALLDAGYPPAGLSTLGHESLGTAIWLYRTPLAAALQYKHAAAAQLLIFRGALSIGTLEEFALCQAVSQQMPEVVAILLQAGASLKAPKGECKTPLMLAVECSNCQILRMLLAAGAQVNTAAGTGEQNATLHVAAQLGHCQVAQMLLDAGAQVNAVDAKGNTPLHVAARYGHTGVLHVLHAERAAVNCTNKYGVAPLMMAAKYCHGAAVAKLLAVGAAVNAANPAGVGGGSTALHRAAGNGHLSIVNSLLAAGANAQLQVCNLGRITWTSCP